MDKYLIQYPESEPCLECVHGLGVLEMEAQKAGIDFPAIVCRRNHLKSENCYDVEPMSDDEG